MGLTHQSLVSPCHSFFPFPSFSLSVLLSGWLLGAQGLSEFTFLPGLLRPDREGALHLHQGWGVLRLHSTKRAPAASVNRASSVPGALLVFCVNQGRSSLSLSALLYFHLGRHPEGTPGSCWGWTLAQEEGFQYKNLYPTKICKRLPSIGPYEYNIWVRDSSLARS